MMRFSVVTPSFNQAEFLGRCLESARRQTLQPVEHLVYDPGSSDGSREIAAAAEGVTLVAEPDLGQGDAVAKGMLRASGDVIAWLNSDDEYADEGVFAAVAEAFASPHKPDIVYGRGVYIGREGEELRPANVIDIPSELEWRLARQVGILQPATFISKKLIERIGPVSRDYHFCMDYEFWVRAQRAGAKFHYLDRQLALARYYQENKTLGLRGESLAETIAMLKAKMGFVHIDWIRRLADFRANGHDGILNSFSNRLVDRQELEKRVAQLNVAINGDFDTLEMLTRTGETKATRPTVSVLEAAADLLPTRYASPIPLETKAVDNAQCYTVGPRRWAFDRSWFEQETGATSETIGALAAQKASSTCIIVGNGPSLNQTDLGALAGQDVVITNYSIINRKLRNLAKYLCVTNYLVAEQGSHEFNTLERIHKIVPYWLSYCILSSPLTHYAKSVGYEKFSTDFRDNISWRSTVSFFAMQVAYALGYRKVLLVGFDHSYQQPKDMAEGVVIEQDEDDPNHFDPRYFKGKQWQAADTEKMEATYRLAKAAFEADGREIVNCTVGGKLELFRRSTLAAELEPVAAREVKPAAVVVAPAPVVAAAPAPPAVVRKEAEMKVLVLDMTPAGNGTATGELKQNLFGGMREVETLQICLWDGVLGHATGGKGAVISAKDAEARIDAFAPDLILYRPVPDAPELHAFAMKQITARYSTPLALWIMDDWPEQLKLRDRAQAEALGRDWLALLERSAVRLSISDQMSAAFARRYGKTFTAVANGVDPRDWKRSPLLVRYGGGLAETMGLDSVVRLAEAVEALAADGVDARLEILTRKHWQVSAGERFAAFKRTEITTEVLPADRYRAWLQGADVLAICYNFDEASQAYVQHSLANKLPECLASGAVVLAHGPASITTMAQARNLGCVAVVDAPSVDQLKDSLRRVASDPAWAADMAKRAREIAFAQFGLERARNRLLDSLRQGMAEHRERPGAAVQMLDGASRRLNEIIASLG